MSEQPMPTAGGIDVTPVARATFLRMLLDREVRGIETYGTTLQTFNGRDAVRDALEELIDAWQYLVQISLELDEIRAENVQLRAEIATLSNAAEAIRRRAWGAHDEPVGVDDV